MGNITLSVLMYFAFSTFVFYQQLHVKNFNGANQGFHTGLIISASMGMISGLVYLGLLAWHGQWLVLLAAFLGGLIVTPLLGTIVERVLGKLTLSVTAFVGWPISAFCMFRWAP